MNQDNDDISSDIDPEVNNVAEILPDLNNSENSDYYSINKFNENCVTNVNDLNIIHCTIRSLYGICTSWWIPCIIERSIFSC